jgi:hypothetical protein
VRGGLLAQLTDRGGGQCRAAGHKAVQEPDALQLLKDAEVAVESGEPVDVAVALVKAFDGLAVQLRDRALDEIAAGSPPDQWSM